MRWMPILAVVLCVALLAGCVDSTPDKPTARKSSKQPAAKTPTSASTPSAAAGTASPALVNPQVPSAATSAWGKGLTPPFNRCARDVCFAKDYNLSATPKALVTSAFPFQQFDADGTMLKWVMANSSAQASAYGWDLQTPEVILSFSGQGVASAWLDADRIIALSQPTETRNVSLVAYRLGESTFDTRLFHNAPRALAFEDPWLLLDFGTAAAPDLTAYNLDTRAIESMFTGLSLYPSTAGLDSGRAYVRAVTDGKEKVVVQTLGQSQVSTLVTYATNHTSQGFEYPFVCGERVFSVTVDGAFYSELPKRVRYGAPGRNFTYGDFTDEKCSTLVAGFQAPGAPTSGLMRVDAAAPLGANLGIAVDPTDEVEASPKGVFFTGRGQDGSYQIYGFKPA